MGGASSTDRLVTACENGYLPSAIAAVEEGASVNDKGTNPHGVTRVPLAAAVFRQHHDVVVWLLSLGADANGDDVMCWGAACSTSDILQLLIDAGGDVNRNSGGEPPLFGAVVGSFGDIECKVRVLLAQPCLDVVATRNGVTPEEYARAMGKPVLADMIAQEVSRVRVRCVTVFAVAAVLTGVFAVLRLGRSRDERHWYGTRLLNVLSSVYCDAGIVQRSCRLWYCLQSTEQRVREAEAADAASVTRLVRSCWSSHQSEQ